LEKFDLEKERKEILNAYKGLLRASKQFRKTREDTQMIRKAFDIAVDAHKNDRRRSGEPYIFHPIAVARICTEEMGLGTTSIVAALLHDTVEDTHITLQEIEDNFGLKVRRIIDGLTKIPEVMDDNVSFQAENFRKLILTISDDLRVAFIKIADRLHNMRTLGPVRRDKKLKTSYETEFLYAPLAHRLGFHAIKLELEDIIFKYKEPEIYAEIEKKIEKSKEVRNRFISQFTHPIKTALSTVGYNYKIKARYKSIPSIYNKIKNKNVDFDEIYDIFAIRIIIDVPLDEEKSASWRVYSMVTDFYQPNPDRLRDWISIPKANGYESLHTTVMSNNGKWVEVQIRTTRMDDIAEKGYAAHWKYKENNNQRSSFDKWIGEIRELLEDPETNAVDFIDEFKMNLFAEEIYVFTPNGDIKVLPKNATTLDFAFSIHSDIGLNCIGAKVNSKLMPLSHALKSGDQVEVIRSSRQKPKREWLKYVVTAKAKQYIKSSLKAEANKISADGKEILERKFKQIKVKFCGENVSVLEKLYGIHTATELYYQIAKGKLDLSKMRDLDMEGKYLVLPKTIEPVLSTKSLTNIISCVYHKNDIIIIGEDFKDLEYTLAVCCSPIPGDDVFAFITNSDGIKVHRTNCPNATQMMSNYAYRVIKATWQSQKLKEELTTQVIKGIDDMGIVNNITTIISHEHNVNMKAISFKSNDGIFVGEIQLYVYDTQHLDKLMIKFEQIEGIMSVDRV